jgi:hypothetical protein
MSENKLRKFRLVDEEGYKASHRLNEGLLVEYLDDNCFYGKQIIWVLFVR